MAANVDFRIEWMSEGLKTSTIKYNNDTGGDAIVHIRLTQALPSLSPHNRLHCSTPVFSDFHFVILKAAKC